MKFQSTAKLTLQKILNFKSCSIKKIKPSSVIKLLIYTNSHIKVLKKKKNSTLKPSSKK